MVKVRPNGEYNFGVIWSMMTKVMMELGLSECPIFCSVLLCCVTVCVLQSVRTEAGDHPASSLKGPRSSSSEGKRPGHEADHTPQ